MAAAAVPYAKPIAADLPGTAECAYVVCVLLLGSGAFLNLLADPEGDPNAGVPLLSVFWILVYVILAVILFKNRAPLRALARRPLLWFPVLWALASVLWSGEPGLTLRRATMLALTTLFGTYLGMRYTRAEFLRMLAILCIIVAISSLVFGLLDVGRSTQGVPGWNGIFLHKNYLGRMMAFAAVVFLVAFRARLFSRRGLLGGLFLCGLLLLLSRSMTALVVTALTSLFLILAPILRERLSRLVWSVVGLLCAGIAIVAWTLSNLAFLSDLIGRSLTLTGRLQLWAVCLGMALRHPWLGYGYSAFWLGLSGPSRIVWQFIRWHPPHAHNGLLSVWLDLGLIGVALFAVAYLVYLGRAARFYRTTHSAGALWPVLFFVFFLLANLTENSVLTANGMFWMLFVATGISLDNLERVPPLCDHEISA